MKKMLTAVVAMALGFVVGCEEPRGGPGATGERATENRRETFTLDLPNLTTDMKQGETKEVKVGVKRGRDFVEDVTLSFEPPKGLTVIPSNTVLPGDKDEAVIKVQAADDVAPGDAIIDVRATPKSGNGLAGTMKVKVDKMTK